MSSITERKKSVILWALSISNFDTFPASVGNKKSPSDRIGAEGRDVSFGGERTRISVTADARFSVTIPDSIWLGVLFCEVCLDALRVVDANDDGIDNGGGPLEKPGGVDAALDEFELCVVPVAVLFCVPALRTTANGGGLSDFKASLKLTLFERGMYTILLGGLIVTFLLEPFDTLFGSSDCSDDDIGNDLRALCSPFKLVEMFAARFLDDFAVIRDSVMGGWTSDLSFGELVILFMSHTDILPLLILLIK